ncbi:MAG: SAM-dependent methyltransferase [Acidobacteria bacterium]|nr:SAM-dependent methyltransferase [Acidobacteriota bacterium]
MRQDYSRTAEGMAMVRALEQHQSPRIIDDPFAATFLLNPYYRWLARSYCSSRSVLRFLRYWAPGGQEFLAIRPRLVDDLVTVEATQGLKQVVILGAGFDTHAWRCRVALTQTIVFEIDHPATQQTKRERSRQLGLPDNLRFVAVDFEQDDFAERLLAAGFDPELPTYFVWVGVSYYLTAQAVADTLQRLSTLSRAGTKLVWDYMLAEVVNGTSSNREALDKGRRAAQLGEPWLWGLAPADVSSYLAGFGFKLIHDYEPAELRERYAPARPLPMSYVRIAMCERAGS